MSPAPEHAILERLPLPCAALTETRLVWANEALLALLGQTREEVLGTSPLELIARTLHGEQTWLEPVFRAGAWGEEAPQELWLHLRMAEGHERTFLARFAPGVRPGEQLLLLLDGEGPEGVRRLTEALARGAWEMVRCRDEREVLEAAVEVIHQQGLWVATLLLEGDTLHHGPMRHHEGAVAAAERLYGCPITEVRFPRDRLPFLEQVFAERKAVFHQNVRAVAETLHAPEVAALIRQTLPAMRALDAPIFVDGRPYGLLTVHGDVLTPASAATLDLFARSMGAALENVRHHQRAREQLEQLERLQGELVAQERLAVLGETAAAVAHEVRNPLGAILNAVAVLRREGRLGPAGTSATAMLEEEAARLEAVVRDLLDVVRPLEARPQQLRVEELARHALSRFRDQPEVAGHPVALRAEQDLPVVEADEGLLLLAVDNLLRNALQASPPGGALYLEVARVVEGVALAVEDEGAAVTPSEVRRAFEPFQPTRASGTGLALAVVRRVALAHGGSVHATPRPGGGARFVLTLPAAPAGAQPSAPSRVSTAR